MDHGHRSRGFSGPPGAHGRGGGRGRVMIPKADRGVYDGKSKRPMIVRKAVDFQSDSITYLSNRMFKQSAREYPAVQPSDAFVKSMLPPAALSDQPTSSITGKHIHKAHNKIPHPTFVLTWTLDGRRLFTGNSAGEITMWDGKTFNFVTLVSTGRNEAVRAMAWTHSGDYLLIGDSGGYVGYYEPTMKPVYALQSHRKAIRGLSFAPTDSKFVSCSDDSTLAIWDFATRKNEAVLEGHNWDVRCVDWHPYNSVIVSGAKDKLIKLWDSKSKTNIHTWQGHKGDVSKVTWNANGNWFLSASRDYSMRIYDIRTMKELQVIRGNGEMCSVSWHPYHEKLFASGDANGDISFWIAGQEAPQGRLYGAHYSAIWDMKWHPFGHILTASGNDSYTSFWCRNRPGEKMEDRYNDPNYTAPPSKMELEAQAQAQAALNALHASATANAAMEGQEGAAPLHLPMTQNDDFSSTQKQLLVPGAVGAASSSFWETLLQGSGTTHDAADAQKSTYSNTSKTTSSKPSATAIVSIPGLGQGSSSLSLRSSAHSSSYGGSTSHNRSRLDTRRDERRSNYHADYDESRGSRHTSNNRDRFNDYHNDRDRERDRERDDTNRSSSSNTTHSNSGYGNSDRQDSRDNSANYNRGPPPHSQAPPSGPFPFPPPPGPAGFGAAPPAGFFPPPQNFPPGNFFPPPHMFPPHQSHPPTHMYPPPPNMFPPGVAKGPPAPFGHPPPGSYHPPR